MLSVSEEQKLFRDGYRDGMQGRAQNVKGVGANVYFAGYKKGVAEAEEAKHAEEVRGECEGIVISAAKNSFEQEIEHNKILREAMSQTRKDLGEEAIKIIDAMELATASKNETIQKLRDYKNTVVREVSEVSAAMSKLKELTSDRAIKEQVASLKEFLALCEKLHGLRSAGFFSDFSELAKKLDEL